VLGAGTRLALPGVMLLRAASTFLLVLSAALPVAAVPTASFPEVSEPTTAAPIGAAPTSRASSPRATTSAAQPASAPPLPAAPPTAVTVPPLEARPLQGERMPAPQRPVDYRGYVILSDATALTLMILGGSTEKAAKWPLVGTGIAVYFVGGPAIHAGYGTREQMGHSIGLRFAAPAGLALLGAIIAAPGAAICSLAEGSDCDMVIPSGAAYGASIGAIAAAIADAAVLAKAPVVAEKTPKRTSAASLDARLAPLVDPRGRGVGLSLAGTFQ
jgi:hypothetical protein